MKNAKIVVAISLLGACSLRGQPAGTTARPAVNVSFESVELVAAGTDHVRFEVQARITASHSVNVSRIKFEEMRVGDIPFYLSPVTQELQLKAGQATALPSLAMTVFFRDLDTLQPIEQVVNTGQVRVRGRASADLNLNLIEKIALRRWSEHAEVPIDNGIPVSLPGGLAGRTAVMLALNAAKSAMGVADSALGGMRAQQQKWNSELKTDYRESLVAAEASYRLLTAEGQTVEVTTRGLGFRIADGRVMLTGEMAEPWNYDPDTAAMIETGRASVVEDSRNISVWAAGEGIERAASLANGGLEIERVATKETAAVVPEAGATPSVRLARRDTNQNYAIVRLTGANGPGREIPLTESKSGDSWDRVAVFKLNSENRTETIFVPARREGDRVIFDSPVDDETFGSPIAIPGGAIGMVQDEHSGMIVRRDR